MEPAPEGGKNWPLVGVDQANPDRRNGARPGGREEHRAGCAPGAHRAQAAMEPAPEGGKNLVG